MDKLIYILICHFGLEKILKNEVKRLGLEVLNVVDGEVYALGKLEDIPRLNFALRTCERVMIEIGKFKATTFDELFNNVYNLEIEKYVPIDGAFPITKANQDKNSIIHSSTAIQSIVKKAMVERLKNKYKTMILPENNGKYPFRVKFNKNEVSIRLDTTGDSLHKRGYRIKAGVAPIEETLAAALVMLVISSNDIKYSDFLLIDPFCGSGTIAIETAMILKKMPPSIDRAFVSEVWENGKNTILSNLDKNLWETAKFELLKNVDKNTNINENKRIFAFDIDENMIKIAKENAMRAGVYDMIYFKTLAVKDLKNQEIIKKLKNGFIVTNPPYGERLEDKASIIPIYKDLKNSVDNLPNLNLNIITSFEDVEKYLGKAKKNRKIYNGMLKSYFYSY